MTKLSTMAFIKKFERPIFTTHELAELSGRSLSVVTQSLNYLESQGIILRIHRGVWAESGHNISAYSIVPFLFPRQKAYVSFVSALHLHGIIEQIPQVITLASMSHTKVITTKLAVFSVHQISPLFFKGFDWYRKKGDFLIAEPEKALADSLYLSAFKKRQFSYFPELNFPHLFSFKKAQDWVMAIPNLKARVHARKKLEEIAKNNKH